MFLRIIWNKDYDNEIKNLPEGKMNIRNKKQFYKLQIIVIILLIGTAFFAQESEGTLNFTAVGNFDAKQTANQKKQNCKQGMQNQINLIFNTTYRITGDYANFRLNSIPAKSPLGKVLSSEDIVYDEATGLCTARYKLDLPALPIYTMKISSDLKTGFIDADTALFQYTKKLDATSYYLSYLTCVQPKEIFKTLIQKALTEDLREKNPKLSLSFTPGTIFSRCDVVQKDNSPACKCLVIFKKENLKEEIINQFKKVE